MCSEGAGLSQPEVAEFFRRAVASGRLAHAYLFLGPKGVGKSEFARELTRHLFCLDRAAKTSTNGGMESCGKCRNCQRLAHGNFPDLHWFTRAEGKRDIIMDDIDRFQREMSFKPVEGSWKVFVVEEADRLNEHSANHMLKVLEEPPAHALILLLAEEEDDMLPTILSRVHVVRFRGKGTDELAHVLECELRTSTEEARFLARLAGGSPGLARKLHEEDFYAIHRKLARRVREMKPGENFEAAEELRKDLGEKTSSTQEERELVCRHLDGLMLELRDELERACASGASGRMQGLEASLRTIMEASEAIMANCNTRLVLENLFFEVASRRAGSS